MNKLLSRSARGALLFCVSAYALSCTLPAATPCERDEECPAGGRCDLESYLCVPLPEAGTDDAAGGGDAMHDAGDQDDAGVGDQDQRDTLRSDTGSAPDLATSPDIEAAVDAAVTSDGAVTSDAAPGTDAAQSRCDDPGVVPASCFTDSFDDENLDARWSPVVDQHCTVDLGQSALVFQTSGGGESVCAVATVNMYDLSDDAVYIQFSSLPTAAGLRFFFKVEAAPNHKFELLLDQDELNHIAIVDGVNLPLGSTAYNPDTRFWRLRYDGLNFYFESAAADGIFDITQQVAAGLDLNHVIIGFGIRTTADLGGTHSLDVKGYNVSP